MSQVQARTQKHQAAMRDQIKRAGEVQRVEGVVPLNPGFFMLERMRMNAVAAAKKRVVVRKKLEDK